MSVWQLLKICFVYMYTFAVVVKLLRGGGQGKGVLKFELFSNACAPVNFVVVT